jgi:hypothetical protein
MNPVNLSRLDDAQLLDLRLCSLDLGIGGTWLEKCVTQLYSELSANDINFHPPCYLADEWLCPDGEPIIGIPFFLAHPRLKALEKKIMLEAEGETKRWCMMLLRHEAGHALNYAYLLHRKKKWRELFGQFSAEYPERYKYRPYSKRFVRHLDEWYAQYHPDEDFAETFAVWLNPKSNWRRKYKGWKALDKLLYVDQLMKEIGKKSPKILVGKKHWDISRMKSTLNTYYRKKRSFYAEHYPDFHDFHLRKIFQDHPAESGIKAVKTIQRHRKAIVDEVSFCTGEKKYIINDLLKDLVTRSRELSLYTPQDETHTVMKISAYVTSLAMNYLYTGRFKKEQKK